MACVLMLTAGASRAGADPPRAASRLDAVQLCPTHLAVEDEAETAVMVAVEAGTRIGYRLGSTGLLRAVHYAYRTDVAIGPRLYVEPIRDRLLVALGAGLLISFGEAIYRSGPSGQPFVEAYAGVQLLRSRQTDLEVGGFGGVALDEDVTWLGLAFVVRQRAW